VVFIQQIFGHKQTQSVDTIMFAQLIIENLGNKPEKLSVEEIQKNIPYTKQPTLHQENILIQSNHQKAQLLVGVDIFVEFNEQPVLLANIINDIIGDQFKITTISNRGTQVWPTGSVYTNCVNQYRVRIEQNSTEVLEPEQVFDLCKKISKQIRICSTEMLLQIDGAKAYSLAQGQ
jgi:isocitrate dehydrogenase